MRGEDALGQAALTAVHSIKRSNIRSVHRAREGCVAAALSAKRIAEIQKLAAGGVSLTAIARQLKVSMSTVHKYAPAGSFDRSATAVAVKARQVDLAARRAVAATNLLGAAERLLEQMWEPSVVFAFGGKDNDYNEHHVDEPSFADKRTLMQAATTALAAHLKLVDHDTESGVDEARDTAKAIAEGLRRLFPAG